MQKKSAAGTREVANADVQIEDTSEMVIWNIAITKCSFNVNVSPVVVGCRDVL